MGEWMHEWMSLNISLASNYESNISGLKEKNPENLLNILKLV